MLLYRHYSFDLWLTLIKSNPAFKTTRTRYFHQHFNAKQKTIEEVAFVFRQVDLMCNSINEHTGGNIDAEEMYLMVISLLNGCEESIKDVDIKRLYEKMENLVLEYMPLLYSEQTAEILSILKEKSGASFSLLSNTGFIKGHTLRKVLKILKIDFLFDHQMYSDEEGMSKPNRALYERMIAWVQKFYGGSMERNQIIHIGDNAYADLEGARAVRIDGLLVHSNEHTLQSLLPL